MSAERRARLLFFGFLIAAVTYVESPLAHYTLTGLFGSEGGETTLAKLRENSSSVLLALLIAFYFDFVVKRLEAKERRAEQERERLRDEQTLLGVRAEVERVVQLHDSDLLSRSDPHDLIKASLGLVYPTQARNVDSLVDNIIGERPSGPILDVTVRHRLVLDENDSSNFVVQRWQTRWHSSCAEPSRYVLAITGTASAGEWATYGCPQVVDCFDVGSIDLVRSTVLAHAATTYIEFIPAGDPHRRAVRKSVDALHPSEWDSVVGGSHGLEDEMALLYVDLPATNDKITVFNQFSLSRASNFVYWQADCPSLVEEISFDTSRVTGILNEGEYVVIPFTGYAGDVGQELGPDTFGVKPSNWLVKGQGAVLTWRPRTISVD